MLHDEQSRTMKDQFALIRSLHFLPIRLWTYPVLSCIYHTEVAVKRISILCPSGSGQHYITCRILHCNIIKINTTCQTSETSVIFPDCMGLQLREMKCYCSTWA